MYIKEAGRCCHHPAPPSSSIPVHTNQAQISIFSATIWSKRLSSNSHLTRGACFQGTVEAQLKERCSGPYFHLFSPLPGQVHPRRGIMASIFRGKSLGPQRPCRSTEPPRTPTGRSGSYLISLCFRWNTDIRTSKGSDKMKCS